MCLSVYVSHEDVFKTTSPLQTITAATITTT